MNVIDGRCVFSPMCITGSLRKIVRSGGGGIPVYQCISKANKISKLFMD